MDRIANMLLIFVLHGYGSILVENTVTLVSIAAGT
jgi:hypothetical protein